MDIETTSSSRELSLGQKESRTAEILGLLSSFSRKRCIRNKRCIRAFNHAGHCKEPCSLSRFCERVDGHPGVCKVENEPEKAQLKKQGNYPEKVASIIDERHWTCLKCGCINIWKRESCFSCQDGKRCQPGEQDGSRQKKMLMQYLVQAPVLSERDPSRAHHDIEITLTSGVKLRLPCRFIDRVRPTNKRTEHETLHFIFSHQVQVSLGDEKTRLLTNTDFMRRGEERLWISKKANSGTVSTAPKIFFTAPKIFLKPAADGFLLRCSEKVQNMRHMGPTRSVELRFEERRPFEHEEEFKTFEEETEFPFESKSGLQSPPPKYSISRRTLTRSSFDFPIPHRRLIDIELSDIESTDVSSAQTTKNLGHITGGGKKKRRNRRPIVCEVCRMRKSKCSLITKPNCFPCSTCKSRGLICVPFTRGPPNIKWRKYFSTKRLARPPYSCICGKPNKNRKEMTTHFRMQNQRGCFQKWIGLILGLRVEGNTGRMEHLKFLLKWTMGNKSQISLDKIKELREKIETIHDALEPVNAFLVDASLFRLLRAFSGIRMYIEILRNLVNSYSKPLSPDIDDFESSEYISLEHYGKEWFKRNHPKFRYHLSWRCLSHLNHNPFLSSEFGLIRSFDLRLDAGLPEVRRLRKLFADPFSFGQELPPPCCICGESNTSKEGIAAHFEMQHQRGCFQKWVGLILGLSLEGNTGRMEHLEFLLNWTMGNRSLNEIEELKGTSLNSGVVAQSFTSLLRFCSTTSPPLSFPCLPLFLPLSFSLFSQNEP